ncbi:hypothetical protein P154DRAFT_252523 [Amniculicola lignicola CBS 123094]|uniref:Uncharacterized protein n=1 Tax=Amniculicola lignicola CBS 123094 TaxID=1392246 RepID=A0A6A5WCB0_9PLEO|nr:hypothetical protein P154DRAFT_252523 [Amniculicola lignicola CBS 123094]
MGGSAQKISGRRLSTHRRVEQILTHRFTSRIVADHACKFLATMTQNICGKPSLGTDWMPGPYSKCVTRIDTRWGNGIFAKAALKCCGETPIKEYQCWQYCAVPDAQFQTWLDCVATVFEPKGYAECQSWGNQTTVKVKMSKTRQIEPYISKFPEIFKREGNREEKRSEAGVGLKRSVGGLVCALLVVSILVL